MIDSQIFCWLSWKIYCKSTFNRLISIFLLKSIYSDLNHRCLIISALLIYGLKISGGSSPFPPPSRLRPWIGLAWSPQLFVSRHPWSCPFQMQSLTLCVRCPGENVRQQPENPLSLAKMVCLWLKNQRRNFVFAFSNIITFSAFTLNNKKALEYI